MLTVRLIGQEPGLVTDTVICQNNKNHIYSIYLPSSYSNQKKWPVVYFFEPAARGSLPVKLYKEVAEELGYILVCTYNSRNGPYEKSFKAADELFLDTENRFSIDFERVIFSGFSGGSRLALSLAVISKAAYGVIGVGAAQSAVPAYMVKSKRDFKYVGLVGSRDMNYLEHKTFDNHLNQMKMDHLMIASNLRHAWAKASDFRIALLWMNEDSTQFQEAMSAKLLAEKDSIPMTDVIALNQFVPNQNIIDLTEKESKKILKEESKYYKKEENLKKVISDSLSSAYREGSLNSPSINWLKKKGQKMKNLRDKADSMDEKMMYDRLLNYLSAASYESSVNKKTQGFTKKALVGITIWESISGNTNYGHWFKAKVYALEKNNSLALQHLEEVLKNGNLTKQVIFNQADFEGLQQDPRFNQLISKYFN